MATPRRRSELNAVAMVALAALLATGSEAVDMLCGPNNYMRAPCPPLVVADTYYFFPLTRESHQHLLFSRFTHRTIWQAQAERRVSVADGPATHSGRAKRRAGGGADIVGAPGLGIPQLPVSRRMPTPNPPGARSVCLAISHGPFRFPRGNKKLRFMPTVYLYGSRL